MIVVRIKGGLGNQMFQYAVGYALSQEQNQPLCFDIAFTQNMTSRGYKLPKMKAVATEVISPESLSPIIKICKNKYVNKLLRILKFGHIPYRNGLYYLETAEKYSPHLSTINKHNLYIDGYFQSPLYFEAYRQELCAQFTQNYQLSEEYLTYQKKIEDCIAVAIHVRRSDFKKDNNRFHYILDEVYYHKAIKYINANVVTPEFYWFSDDITWVKQQFGEKKNFNYISLSTPNADIDELMLMSQCKHIIAANSTFSWWAAWLNQNKDAIKIVPAKRYGNAQMIPDGWIKL